MLRENARTAAGDDKDAWNRLVERFMPLVRSIIHWYSLSGQDAADVHQILWLRLVEHLDRIEDPKDLPEWIATTTHHECLRLLRSTWQTVPVGGAAEAYPESQSDREAPGDVLRAQQHHLLIQALAQLPDPQRTLLILLVADPPPSPAEISRRLGIPTDSVEPTRTRALQRLRECYAMAALKETTTERIR